MKTIPDTVKIQGKIVRVGVSGRGYVYVGESSADMSIEKKMELQAIQPREAHIELWENEMYRLFEKALKLERKRLKQYME